MPAPTTTMLKPVLSVNFSVVNATPTRKTTMGMDACKKGGVDYYVGAVWGLDT